MTRAQLEHLIRASGDIADDDELIIVGSQAILGQFPDAPEALRISVEADIYPKNRPERADLIDGSIGEGSPFHDTYGYYAQGVGEGTAVLPAGWQARLVPIRNDNTRQVTGWCLEVHDLFVAKCVAGREKDLLFVNTLARHNLADETIVRERVRATPLDPRLAAAVTARAQRAFR